jgi:hypothetical protein
MRYTARRSCLELHLISKCIHFYDTVESQLQRLDQYEPTRPGISTRIVRYHSIPAQPQSGGAVKSQQADPVKSFFEHQIFALPETAIRPPFHVDLLIARVAERGSSSLTVHGGGVGFDLLGTRLTTYASPTQPVYSR